MMEGLAVSPHLDRWPSTVLMATHGHPEKTPVVLSCFPPWIPEGPAAPVKLLPGSRCSEAQRKALLCICQLSTTTDDYSR